MGAYAKAVNTQRTKRGQVVTAQSTELSSAFTKAIAKDTKYRNQRTEIDGLQFDSKKEAQRYCELRLLQRAGMIANLQRQVPFELIPAQKINGKVVERALKYIADFVYTENGETVVEDVKGMKTDVYKLKRKLMLWEFGIRIREV